MTTSRKKHHDRIYFRCSDELVLKGKELCAKLGMDWNSLIQYLVMGISRPGLIQRKYECHYDESRDSFIEASVREQTWINFKTFAAVFTSDRDAFDYLVYSEIENKKGVTLSGDPSVPTQVGGPHGRAL